MNRFIAFFLVLLTAFSPAADLTPESSRVITQGRTPLASDQSWFRDRIATPGISTAQNAAAVNFVFMGDSFTAGTASQVPWPTQFRANFRRGENTNRGVGGETSVQIKARFDALPVSDYQTKTFIFACGRNNFGDSGVQAKSDIDGMIATLATYGNTRWLVVGITNDQSEVSGSANYVKCLATNNLFATSYGTKFVNIRPILISYYNPSIPQDVIDFNNDVTPSSLRIDTLHPNTAGYKIISDAVYATYTANYPVADTAVTMSNIEALFSNPFDRQVPYWITSANPIMAVTNTGARISTNATLATSQNGDGFTLSGHIYGNQQNDIGGSSSANWVNRGFFKTLVQVPFIRPANSSGTNIAGVDLNIGTGASTGTGASGVVNLQATPSGSSGSAANALVTSVRADGDTTSGNTRFMLFDNVKGSLQRVKVGANDSAGTGKRALYLDN